MTQPITLDVSLLEPPEPMERILEATEILQPGQYLLVLHHREPFPLYSILAREGFSHSTRAGRQTPYEIFIWRTSDVEATASVQSALNS